VIPTHGSYFRSGLGRLKNCPTSTRSSSPLNSEGLALADAEAVLKARQHPGRRRARDLEPDDLAEAAAEQLELDRLEQVVGLVGYLEVGVARDAKSRVLDDLHLRKEQRQKVADHALERKVDASLADGQEARQEFRHFDARETLLARVRVTHEESEAEREPRDVRKRLAWADGERRQHGEDLPLEAVGQLLELLRLAVLDVCDDDSFSGQRRSQLALPKLRLPRHQVEHAFADLGEGLRRRCGRPASACPTPASSWPEKSCDADHEELVEVRREDGAEANALEQRHARIGGELEDARVEVERRELTVEKAVPADPVGGLTLRHRGFDHLRRPCIGWVSEW
jgi:hypothetical protein